jgi:hypothetical protein
MPSKWLTWVPDPQKFANVPSVAPTKPSESLSKPTAAPSETFVGKPRAVSPNFGGGDGSVDELAREFVGESMDEWQANLINTTLAKYGVLKQPGRITAETVKHGRLARRQGGGDRG